MANTAQGIYAPLPQSISDSDSERETPHVENLRPKSLNGTYKKMTNGYAIPNHTVASGKEGFSAISRTKKICFILSILACFLTIAMFLWVLPCSGTCPKRIPNWENQREDFEYAGRINVVASAFPNVDNLVLLIRKSIIKGNESINGAISIIGSNGEVAWLIPQVRTPKDLNCYLIDVNRDGNLDCLLLGETGLEAIDPISGEIYYHVHNQNDNGEINNINMPIVLVDLNGDGVEEMITTINGKILHNKLIIICGRTGTVLSKIVLKQCAEVKGLQFVNEIFIFSCKNASVEDFYKLPLKEIEGRFNNKSFDVNPVKTDYKKKEKYILNHHRLEINNTGSCPDCSTSIAVINGKNNTIWFSSYSNSYSMKPTLFSFQPTDSENTKGYFNGYVIKLWKYTDFKSKRKYSKRSIPSVSRTQKNLIDEMVMLITFNDTSAHVINVSHTKITQLCVTNDNNDEQCQPLAKNQENSLEICDLDKDGSQELVSYSSNYVGLSGEISLNREEWKLVSNMKIIRFETELKKLYETK